MIERYNQTEINKLAKILKNDGVISVPTDTVYGVCARINSVQAYNKLVAVKNRPYEKSFPIMCANIEQIKNIAYITDKAEKLINAFMPGPITIVLKKKENLPEYISNGKDTIAIRMATSKALEELILEIECPVFMTSANQSGKPTCTNLDEIENQCPMIDGMMEGSVHFGQSSTIVDCTKDEIKVLREGPVTIEQIKNVL